MKKIVVVTPPDLSSLNHLKTLIGILKNHYDVSVISGDLNKLSENEKILLESINTDGVQIMNSFQDWTFFELMKLAPFLFQLKADIYHFLIPPDLSYKHWPILLSLAYLVKSIPGTQISMTSSSKKNWWLSQLRILVSSEITLENNVTRFSLNKVNLKNLNYQPNDDNNNSGITFSNSAVNHSGFPNRTLITRETIAQFADQWFIPYAFSEISEEGLHFLIQVLNEFNFKIVIRGWGDFSLFKQNKVRLQFQKFTDRLIIKPLADEEIASEIFKSRGVILFGNKNRPNWTAHDLYFFINHYKTTFLIEKHQIESLEFHWINGDTHWELDKDDPMNSFRKIINQNISLKFQGLEKISENKNQSDNKILRSFNTLSFKG